MRVLAGDIGGTKTWLQMVDFPAQSKGASIICEQRYQSASYSGLVPMLREFLASATESPSSTPDKACFGVAGPITESAGGQSVKVTNLPWEFSTENLARELAIQKIRLINDFQAVGYGIEALEAHDLVALQTALALPGAPRLVIGAGTGLGTGLLIRQDDHYEALSSEGGHINFAPTDELQIDLLNDLMERAGRVSYERVLSGPGLVSIYEFLCRRSPDETGDDLQQALWSGDQAAVISEFALSGRDKLASQALDVFVDIYGAYAGDLALVSLARGGVYIAGGIAPKIIERLKSGGFMHAFNAKGRMSRLVGAMSVQVVMNPKVGLMGAALAASRL